ncbi:hypothetical protein [Streptomyces drozdowiczii]|uniref:Secreted protein n=1 Tax=Streptomyces drozdowiczii TaxID=202862 RepID=A0ABY6PW47_9ACTN|nr:hypothetical protein [Streptomyces drozdowiczii]MCX0243529.1 hypothetical protein [Streptomyces drozdowiczii]UZK56559.1 hypothetical protein NEH16_22940 [Streptomyces drozdowiczii]
MHAVLIVFGLLLSTIVCLIVKVNLRHRRRTHNFDGQEIERQHSAEIRNVRAANNSVAVHNSFVNGGNEYRPGRR